MGYSVGIDIGGTFIKYAIVDEEYNIIEKWKVPTLTFDTKEAFYDYLCESIVKNESNNSIDRIGISAPGLISEDSTVNSLAAPALKVMYKTNVNKEVEKRTGKIVKTINDAKAAGLCELKIGNAIGTKSSAFLIIGTGAGGCLCNENDVIYGQDAFAGEVHFIPFIDIKNNNVVKIGNLSSIRGLTRLYNSKVNEEDAVSYGNEITNKYLNGDKLAIDVIEEWLRFISLQMIGIITCYNPEIICIGGGISEEKWFIEALTKKYKEISRDYFNGDFITTKIKSCKYNNDSNILGAILKTTM